MINWTSLVLNSRADIFYNYVGIRCLITLFVMDLL